MSWKKGRISYVGKMTFLLFRISFFSKDALFLTFLFISYLFSYHNRCVKLGEDEISNHEKNKILEERAQAEKEYKVMSFCFLLCKMKFFLNTSGVNGNLIKEHLE